WPGISNGPERGRLKPCASSRSITPSRQPPRSSTPTRTPLTTRRSLKMKADTSKPCGAICGRAGTRPCGSGRERR
ncbi:MAG: hypothetical protein AVDCRST_MAG01-01-1090, partial [uncultured Rubrobacteraceae bacterium]